MVPYAGAIPSWRCLGFTSFLFAVPLRAQPLSRPAHRRSLKSVLKLFSVLIIIPSLQFPFALTAFKLLQFCSTILACFHQPAKTIVTGRIAGIMNTCSKHHVLSVVGYQNVFVLYLQLWILIWIAISQQQWFPKILTTYQLTSNLGSFFLLPQSNAS